MGGPLDTVTRRAGAVMTRFDGLSVAAHYGSPAGELAVCVRAVGLADRSDLVKLVVSGEREAIPQLVRRLSGSSLAAGGTVLAAGSWWCAASPSRVIILSEPVDRPALLEAIADVPGVEITDCSTCWSAIALVGEHTVRVLSALGALGVDADPRLVPPFGSATVGGTDVDLLLQSDRRAVMLVDPRWADRVWRATEKAGRGYGLSCVGVEAVNRFALLDRMLERAPVAATG